MEGRTSIGFFGKLPCNGDFLQRRVPQSFLEVWDPWLQECMHASKSALQENWLNSYLTSPVWRFVLPDAACGSGAYAGAMAPSVDRVGRYFPLTIVMQIDIGVNPLEFAAQQGAWFDALEALIVTALEHPQIELEWFDGQVLELASQLTQGSLGEDLDALFGRNDFPQQGASWRVPLRSAAGLQEAVRAFAYREISRQLRPATVWWSEGSGAATPSWLSQRGLPAPHTFGAMLTGEWLQHGWNNLGELQRVPAASSAVHLHEAPIEASESLVPLAAPQTTVPDVQLSAIESNRAAFILRPEIGLFAVAATEPAGDSAAIRAVADALHQIIPAPTLTSAVEAVRFALTEVHRELLRLAARDVMRIEAKADVVVLVISGGECAVLSAGTVQIFRVRARAFEALGAPVRNLNDSGSLMDLLSNDADAGEGLGCSGFQDLQVQYEQWQREDQWILSAHPSIGAAESAQLAAAAAGGIPLSAVSIIEVLGPLSAGAVVPVMTVEA
jgi:type VI secretion system protein ImpM